MHEKLSVIISAH